MRLGILVALLACFIWSFNFIVPQMIPSFSPLDITIGRYLCYGIFAVAYMVYTQCKWTQYSFKEWCFAFVLTLFSNVLYYIALVMALRYASPPVTVLIISLTPVVIALYGNWKVQEVSFSALSLPLVMIVLGIIAINIRTIDWHFQEHSIGEYLLGLGSAVFALSSWSWYAVHNARFLKKNLHIKRSDWSALLGVTSGIWALVLAMYHTPVFRALDWSSDSWRYLSCILFLGILCSWTGGWLWNVASSYLPLSLLGALSIMEMIFGIILIYTFSKSFPSWSEWCGIVLILSGVCYTIRLCRPSYS